MTSCNRYHMWSRYTCTHTRTHSKYSVSPIRKVIRMQLLTFWKISSISFTLKMYYLCQKANRVIMSCLSFCRSSWFAPYQQNMPIILLRIRSDMPFEFVWNVNVWFSLIYYHFFFQMSISCCEWNFSQTIEPGITTKHTNQYSTAQNTEIIEPAFEHSHFNNSTNNSKQ